MATPTPNQGEGAHREYVIDGARIGRGVGGLRITRPWVKAAGYFMLLWVAVWFGLVGFFSSLGTHLDNGLTTLLVLPGIGMAYAALTRFFNSTVIEVTPLNIMVHHVPMPWPGRRCFATHDVVALHIEVKRIYAKGAAVDECRISIERKNGKKSMLVKGLEMSALQMSGIAAAMSEYLSVPVYAD